MYYYYVLYAQFGTILDVLKGLGDEDTGFLYTQIFVASLPLGFLTIPIITHCLQQFGLVHTFHVIVLLGSGYSGFLMVKIRKTRLVHCSSFYVYTCRYNKAYDMPTIYYIYTHAWWWWHEA